MKTSSEKSERLAGVILIGLLFSGLVVGAIWFYLHKSHESKSIPIEEAMYVTDSDITIIYGPGTPQQAKIVDQFRSYGADNFEFDSPVLYRMNHDASGNSGEGILLMGFDPNHPEMAHGLKASR